jgi:hypothetical protein
VEESGSTSTERQILTFPITVTLATPSPVSPTVPVVNGSNSVSLGARAEIVNGMTVSMGNGGLLTQPDALLNETWSRGTAALNDRVRVRGTLHARTRTNGANVSVTTWDQNPAFEPRQELSWKVSYPTGPANNVVLNAGEELELAPGKHGAVTVNSQGRLTLRSGTYYLTSLSLQSATSTTLIQHSRGPVIIYVTDGVTLRGAFVPPMGESPDLLIVHLGTQPVFVETLFDGALLAPSAPLTFRSVTGTHTGFFYAKDPFLDAGAKVRYRAPLAIIKASGTNGSDCLALAAGQVPSSDLSKYCSGCEGHPLDTDRDGYLDCAESCDFDPLKTAPGACDCNVPDTDTDGDRTPDCNDPCDLDPNSIIPGQCGCASTRKNVRPPRPAGTRCTDTAGPVSGTPTCNGTGACGNPSASNPGGCRLLEDERTSYWLCPGPATQPAAAAACRARQMALVRINGFQENAYLQSVVTKPVWIGANSITTAGTWRWGRPADNNGDQFWAGSANGSQRNALFSFWATGSPASQRCAVIQPGNARWRDVDCNQALGFICEFVTPDSPLPPPEQLAPTFGNPGPTTRPMSSQCVTTANSFLLPEHPEGQENFDGIDEFVPYQEQAALENFMGPAQAPPTERVNPASCVEALDPSSGIGPMADGYGCEFTVPTAAQNFVCPNDGACTQFGTGLECREIQDSPTCLPEKPSPANPDGIKCSGHARCGTLVCPQQNANGATACQTIEVCDPETNFVVDSGGTNLTPEPFNPGHLFGAETPPVVQPSTAYLDGPGNENGPLGKNHKWCFMNPQNDIAEAEKDKDNKLGNANGGSKISFSFDPSLQFKADVNPLSLGETDLDVLARAELVTKVKLTNFIGATFEEEVLSAVAAIQAHRCTLRTDDTQFAVFGSSFVDLDGIPLFDTSDKDNDQIVEDGKHWFETTNRCNERVGAVITAVNRAKKAFRDAQQLIEQFKNAKLALSDLSNLCQNVVELVGAGGVDVPGFPDGLACPEGEPTEVTINRFIDYYQAPGVGQIARMRKTVEELRTVTAEIFEGLSETWTFGPEPFGESRTIVEAQFQIGPVPAVIEISAFYSYGVKGYFEISLKPPFDPFEDPPKNGQPPRNEIAAVRAGVMPFANAGLSAFVGLGKRLGPFSATLGIEGSVMLANVEAPIFAGAGLGAEVQVDNRSLAPDIAAVLGPVTGIPTHIGIPKSFKFFVWYEYGASLIANQILQGQINGRLRIKFAFFSRTWKKRVANFNGLPPINITLVNGKVGNDPGVAADQGAIQFQTPNNIPATATASTIQGTTDMGMSEATVPLLVLDHVDVPIESVEPEEEPVPFNAEAVEGMFYDSLCCARLGEECLMPKDRAQPGGPVPCCPGAICRFTTAGSTECSVDCRQEGESCATVADCCTDQKFVTTCEDSQCLQCGIVAPGNTGAPCSDRDDCCDSGSDELVDCVAGHCNRVCLPAGSTCSTNDDCCTADRYSCNTQQKCCGFARTNSVPGVPGSPCTQNSDCCGFDAPNSSIVCKTLTGDPGPTCVDETG